MVGVSSCAIPGCAYRHNRSNVEKRAIFTVYRPDLAKNEQEKAHREMLTRFILSMRNAKSPADNITAQLHKESAGICEIHFDKENIEITGKRKKLKLGAKPCYNLPKSSSFFQTPQRKPPAIRCLSEAVLHKTFSDVKQSYRRLNPTLQEKWKIIENTSTMQLIRQEENILIPKFRIILKEDICADSFEIYGWQVQFPVLQMTNLNVTTLYSFIDNFERLKTCNGIEAEASPQDAINHPILRRKDRKVIVCSTSHSLNCAVYCDNQELNRCSVCDRLQRVLDQENASSSSEIPCTSTHCGENIIQPLAKGSSNPLPKDDVLPITAERPLSNPFQKEKSAEPIATVFTADIALLNSWQKLFLQEQLRHASYSPHGRRNGVSPKPGINERALGEISRVIEKHGKDLTCYLTLDEMKIKENLVINDGQLVGFVNYGSGSDEVQRAGSDCLATHILAFYLRSSNHDISIPISWYPTTSTPAYMLAILFWKAVRECEARGASILALICDGHPNNRKFMKLISKNDDFLHNFYTAPNPFAEDREILLCLDPSHLLKTARNSLFASKPTGTRYLHKNGKDILWTDVVQLFKAQQSSMLAQQSRLSADSVFLNSYSKMKVGLAREVLSWNVGQCLSLVPNAQGTSEYILMFARWFDIGNCGPHNAIRSTDDVRLDWLENEFICYLLNWKEEVDSQHKGENKRIIANPTLEGLIFTTRNFVCLAKHLLQNGSSKVWLKTFSQDVLEAFFGNVRSSGRRSTNPDVSQTAYAIEHITSRKIIKKIKGGNTTHGKINPWTDVCDEPLSKRIRC